MQTQLPQIVSVVFTVVTALGVLLQALVLLGMYFAIRKTTKEFRQTTDEFKTHLIPAITAARRLIEDISPKLKIASSNLVEVSHTLRHQATRVSSTMDNVVDKTNVQAARVDEVLKSVVDSVEHAAGVVQHAAAVPIREVSGIMAGLKAGFDVLRGKEKKPSEPPVPEAQVPEEVIP